jgi:sec-independent protein translocase protein TatA
MGGFSMVHWLIFGIVAVLLFGNRLPSVARSLGRSFVEFKKGMSDLESEFKSSVYSEPTESRPRVTYTDHSEPAAPRFEPPKAQQDVRPAEQKPTTVV